MHISIPLGLDTLLDNPSGTHSSCQVRVCKSGPNFPAPVPRGPARLPRGTLPGYPAMLGPCVWPRGTAKDAATLAGVSPVSRASARAVRSGR